MDASQLERARTSQPSNSTTIVDLTSESDDDDIYFMPNRAQRPNNKPPTMSPPADFIDASPDVSIQGSMNTSDQEYPGPFLAKTETWQDQRFLDDEAYARALQEQLSSRAPTHEPQVFAHPTAAPDLCPRYVPLDPLVDCMQKLEAVFPGICLDHVAELFKTVSDSPEALIDHILTKDHYPRAKDMQIALKRKRELDPDEEAARKYGAPDRIIPGDIGGILPYIRTILGSEYPYVPLNFVDSTLSSCGYRLFSAYQILFEAVRTNTKANSNFKSLQRPRKVDSHFTEASVAKALAQPDTEVQKIEVLKELQVARKIRRRDEAHYAAEREAELQEEENVKHAKANGLMGECGCCCDDVPLNRMVHCNGDNPHSFCRDCARRNAETEVGKSKYELNCMSVEPCTGGFSLEQRLQFLDEKTCIALDRNEQEAVLRMAGIENLESCPFCPFAAEYPPIENDREFRCQDPDCEKVSCRLCREESHIPKSCEENMRERGLSIRRQLEEAMSAALIRKCNKCGTPFVKEEGCNKMTCTRNGCKNVQCYVCSKSCNYSHFNDTTRGGKAGNCPLFDNVDLRHEGEVSKAEKEALHKIMTENPKYTEEDLKIKMSDNVKEDDQLKKQMPDRGIRIPGVMMNWVPDEGLQEFWYLREMAGERAIPIPFYPFLGESQERELFAPLVRQLEPLHLDPNDHHMRQGIEEFLWGPRNVQQVRNRQRDPSVPRPQANVPIANQQNPAAFDDNHRRPSPCRLLGCRRLHAKAENAGVVPEPKLKTFSFPRKLKQDDAAVSPGIFGGPQRHWDRSGRGQQSQVVEGIAIDPEAVHEERIPDRERQEQRLAQDIPMHRRAAQRMGLKFGPGRD